MRKTGSLTRFWSSEGGATAIEYGLIVALLALALVTVLTQLGGGSDGLFQGVVAVSS